MQYNICFYSFIGTFILANMVMVVVFSATFNNISAITWRSVLLVDETVVPGENHQSVASHGQNLSHNVVSITPLRVRDGTYVIAIIWLVWSLYYLIFIVIDSYQILMFWYMPIIPHCNQHMVLNIVWISKYRKQIFLSVQGKLLEIYIYIFQF